MRRRPGAADANGAGRRSEYPNEATPPTRGCPCRRHYGLGQGGNFASGVELHPVISAPAKELSTDGPVKHPSGCVPRLPGGLPGGCADAELVRAKWQAPLIEMMSRSGSAGTGVDPDAATERQTMETTSRMVKAQEPPEPKATKVLARATQATERAQVAVRSSPAHATSRRAAVRELLTAVAV